MTQAAHEKAANTRTANAKATTTTNAKTATQKHTGVVAQLVQMLPALHMQMLQMQMLQMQMQANT